MGRALAVRDILKGEEILISYTLEHDEYSTRVSRNLKHGFVCECSLCGMDDEAKAKSDERRRKIRALDASALRLLKGGTRENILAGIEAARQRLALIHQEFGTSLDPSSLSRSHYDIFQGLIFLEDFEAAEAMLDDFLDIAAFSWGGKDTLGFVELRKTALDKLASEGEGDCVVQ